MLNRNINFRLQIRTKKSYWAMLAYCFLVITISFQCTFGIASAGEQQIGQKVKNETFMFREVLKNGDLMVASIVDGIYRVLNGAVEIINTALAFYEEAGSCGDKNGQNCNNDSDSHWKECLMLFTVLVCLITVIFLSEDEKCEKS